MDIEQVKYLLLPIHAIVGFLALLLGAFALFAKKSAENTLDREAFLLS